MKTLKQILGGIQNTLLSNLAYLSILFLILLACSKSDAPETVPKPTESGMVTGFVLDDMGNPYPSTLITVKKGDDEVQRATDASGMYTIRTHDVGSYSIEIELPLMTKLLGNNPSSVNVAANQTTTANFMIEPKHVPARVNIGNVQVIEEIKDINGNTPVAPTEPLYAENIFDPPLGLLTAIQTPTDHHVVLDEFKEANGHLFVRCDGASSTVEISLEGMIPGGTYTFWLAFLNKIKHVGEGIDFMNDFVYQVNPPLGSGSGTENIAIADANGAINVTIAHGSCILTDHVALIIPVVYHLNGNTYGAGHIPDAEEVTHMLVYFQ